MHESVNEQMSRWGSPSDARFAPGNPKLRLGDFKGRIHQGGGATSTIEILYKYKGTHAMQTEL